MYIVTFLVDVIMQMLVKIEKSVICTVTFLKSVTILILIFFIVTSLRKCNYIISIVTFLINVAR